MAAPTHPDEANRLAMLHELDILDTASEASFDHIALMGKRSFRVPICLVSLVDTDRQWFKSCYGLTVEQTPRDVAFCAHAIMPDAPDIFEVPDTTLDARFRDNPLVTGDPFIRYYAGAPLIITKPGMAPQKMGTFCVIDTKPRPPMDREDRETLLMMAALVVDQFNSRLYATRVSAMNAELLRRTAEVNAINLELSSLVDTANAPIFAVDAEMRVTAWNRKISQITSVERTDIEGRDIRTLISVPDDGQEARSAAPDGEGGDAGAGGSHTDDRVDTGSVKLIDTLQRALAGEGCACHDFELRSRVHARHIHLQVSAEPKHDSDGRVVGVVCVGEDVAHRVRVLETMIHNRELQRTNEAKDVFLASMSHEMRTPLNGLLGMLQLAMGTEEAVPETVRRYLKQAQNSGTLLLNLINDILDIARIEAGQIELDACAFSLRPVMEETVALVQTKALEKGLSLELDIEPALDRLCQHGLIGDVNRVQQVLLNLLWNALKFTSEGHVRLSVRCTSVETTGTDRCRGTGAAEGSSSRSSATPASAAQGVEGEGGAARGGDAADAPPSVADRREEAGSRSAHGIALSEGGSSSTPEMRAAESSAEGGSPEMPALVHLVFEVSDTGIGIASEDQAVIFQRFARAKQSRYTAGGHATTCPPSSDAGSGVGLGMSICKQLVELMGGRIWLHSELGRGTNVFVKLALAGAPIGSVGTGAGGSAPNSAFQAASPICQAPSRSSSAIPPPLRTHGKASADGGSGGGSRAESAGDSSSSRQVHVLVVEDNDYNVDVVKQMLEVLGHRVTVASEGWQAMQLILEADLRAAQGAARTGAAAAEGQMPFDAILMDCDMPIMNGFEATRTLRVWERTGNLPEAPPGAVMSASIATAAAGRESVAPPARAPLPVIAVTAYAFSTDKTRCFEAGMDDYITKPLAWSVLRDKLMIHTKRSAVVGTISPSGSPSDSPTSDAFRRESPLVALMRKHQHSRGVASARSPSISPLPTPQPSPNQMLPPGHTLPPPHVVPSAAAPGAEPPPSTGTGGRAAADPTRPVTMVSQRGGGSSSVGSRAFQDVATPAAAPPSERTTASILSTAAAIAPPPPAGAPTQRILGVRSDLPLDTAVALSIAALPERPTEVADPTLTPQRLRCPPQASGAGSCPASGSRLVSVPPAAADAPEPPACTPSSSAHDSADERPPFLLHEIEGIFGGNLQLVRMALTRYDTTAYDKLVGPWEQRNYKRLGTLAHSLKGAVSYICANEAKRAAARLEQSAKALADAESSELLQREVADALRDVRKELERIGPAVEDALRTLSTPPSVSQAACLDQK